MNCLSGLQRPTTAISSTPANIQPHRGAPVRAPVISAAASAGTNQIQLSAYRASARARLTVLPDLFTRRICQVFMAKVCPVFDQNQTK